MKPRKWFSMLIALTMILALIPASAFAEPEPIVEPNFGFVPNSGEASVSKVDLVNKTEVARYYTEPRVSPTADYNWRTSRIAMDAEGNAWVLNTGADGVNLQGSVARIQADTTGLITHAYPDPILAFGTDEAVKVFDVGGLGDMPRAIAIDEDGYIWIGFYSSGALMKFEFDGTDLTKVGDTIYNEGNKLNFYEMKFAPDGMLYISSRNSTPTRAGNPGVWSFDPDTGIFTEEWNVDSPYSLLIDPDSGQVYATSYSNVLWIKGTGTVAISGAQNLRGMAFDDLGKIWIASTTGGSGGDRVCWYDIGAGTSGYITLPIGTTPVGVGMDEAGLMWAVCRTDGVTAGGYLVAFDPSDGSPQGSIRVGYRPYAYGDFVMPVPRYCIEGTKTEDFWTGLKTRLPVEGFSIYLYDRTLDPGEVPGVATEGLLASTMTDEFGDYSFCNLVAGTYYVYEMFDDCYAPFEPINGMREVKLPAEGNDGNAVDQDFVNRRGKIQGIKFKDVLNGESLEGWEILLYKGEPAVGEPNKVDAFMWTTTDSQGFYAFEGLCPDTYYAYELMQDGWVQTHPTEGFWTVELAAGARATGKHFVNEEEEFYDLCGFKYGLDYAGFMMEPWPTDNPLEGWTIILERFEDDEWVEIDRDITNVNGKYCFLDLPAGEYRLSEEADSEKDGFWMMNGKYWLQVGPEGKYIFASLPDDGMECGDCDEISIDCMCPPPPVEKSFDFYNLCHTGETAWMFGDLRFIEDLGLASKNWGWSLAVGIPNELEEGETFTQDIYAGAAQGDLSKGYLIGSVEITWNGTAFEFDFEFDDDVAVVDTKIWVGNTALPIFRGTMTNAPGKLIIDPNTDYSDEVFIAIHFDSYVPCGFPHPEMMPE